jgi:Holliday junction resolvasome RuvABC endonuclease subunit
MIILVLDPGTSTGYCLADVDYDNETATIYEYGYINVDDSSDYQGDHCIDLMSKIQYLIETHWVESIAIEDYFFNKRTATGSNVNAAFRTAIHILARQNDIPYTILNISSWKTFIAGRCKPTKDQKKQWGNEPSKKIMIQDALWKKYKIRFPNHSISEKTGKPISFRYDVVDVVGQTIYFICMVNAIPKKGIVCTVEPPSDVVVKSRKTRYVYL